MSAVIELISAIAGTGALAGGAGAAGRWLVQKLRAQESESIRVWKRLNEEEDRRKTLEEDVTKLREERIELLEQLSLGVSLAREVEDRHHRRLEEVTRRLDQAQLAHHDCTTRLQALGEAYVAIETRLGQVSQRVAQEARRTRKNEHASNQNLKAQKDSQE